MKKYAILFALILAACGEEPVIVDDQSADTEPTYIVVNASAPDCDWNVQVYHPVDGCVNLEEDDIVLECEEGEHPVIVDGQVDCQDFSGCPEGYEIYEIMENGDIICAEIPTTLEISFSTVFSTEGWFMVNPGRRDVNFGTFLFDVPTGDSIQVTHLTLTGYLDLDGNHYFNELAELQYSLFNFVENCRLRGWPETVIWSGPTDPHRNGELHFTEDFEVNGHLALNLVCDIRDITPENGYAAFSFDFTDPNNAETTAESVSIGNTNGRNSPVVAAYIDLDGYADVDGDGYSVIDGDCDDTRSDIHPGAQEICDGVDNDCNGTIDINYMGVDMRSTFYLDQDQDGFGDPNHFELRCSHGGLLSATNGLDCNDSRADTHPGAEEICGDGVDNNCDGHDIQCSQLTYCTGTSPEPGIILANSHHVWVGDFTFWSPDNLYITQRITLINCLAVDDDGSCVQYGDDSIAGVVRIEYEDSNHDTVTKSGYFTDHRLTFTALDFPSQSDFYSGSLRVTVSTPMSASGLTSGAQVGVMISTHPGQRGAFTAIRPSDGAVMTEQSAGLGACNTLDPVDQRCRGRGCLVSGLMTFRHTKPTISLAAGSPSGAGVPGMSEILRINVSADSRGYVVLKELGFKIVTADEDHDFNLCDTLADPSKFDFYDTADPSTLLDDDGDWLFVDDDGEEIMDCDPGRRLAYAFWIAVGDSTVGPVEIPAGQTYTFALEIDTTGASSAEDDGLRVDIPTEAEVNALSASDADAVRWSDASYDRNIDGTYIHNLPIRGGFVQY